jgi:hypothetical protein
LPGGVGVAGGFAGVSELEEDVGFGAPVSDLAEDYLGLLVGVDGLDGVFVAIIAV